MRLLILGATGKTGQALIREAIHREYIVTAMARQPASLDEYASQIRIISGDMLNPDSLHTVMDEDYDAIISALGLFPRSPCTKLSTGTANLLAAMPRHHEQRLVLISSFGCGGTDTQAPFLLRMFAFRYLFKHTIADKNRQEQLIRDSDMRYTILRPAGLYDGAAQSRTHLWQDDKPAAVKRFKTSRLEVARVALDCAADDGSIKKTLMMAE